MTTSKVAVVTDSIASLPRELVEQYKIGIVPISLYFQGKVYRDWVDISPTEAYEMFLKDPEAFFQLMKNKVGQSPVHVAVMHAYAPDEAEKLKERAESEFNCTELFVTEFSPVMGYACGVGAVGFAFYKDD